MGAGEMYLQQGDGLLAGIFMVPEQLASYFAARTLLRMYTLFSQSVNFLVLPVSSRLAAVGDFAQLRHKLKLAMLAIWGVLLPLNVAVWFLCDWLFPLILSDKYIAAIPFFRILLLASFVEPVYSVLANSVAGIGRPQAIVPILAIAVVVNIAANLWVIPTFGLVGMPFVLVATYAVLAVGMLRIFRREFRTAIAASEAKASAS